MLKTDGDIVDDACRRPVPFSVSATLDNPIAKPTSRQTGHPPSSASQRRGNERRKPLLSLLLLHLFGLPGREMDVPDEDTLENEADEDDKEDCKEDGLVVERHDGLLSGADGAEPLEPVASTGEFLAHCDGRAVVESRRFVRGKIRARFESRDKGRGPDLNRNCGVRPPK